MFDDTATLSWLILAVAGLITFYLLADRRRRRRGKDPATTGQLPWPMLPMDTAPSRPPIFRGVRVVEVASVFAVPSVGRCFADLGAEVIKVEGPGGAGNGADSNRALFLEYQSKKRRARGVGPMFEALNCGKRSVCLDLKKDRAGFIEMLRGADVLVTNVRKHQLRGLGLDYDDIRDECPHLVFAHLTAWGRDGPDSMLPGFDASAFWAASGLAYAVQKPYMYSAYPVGFGDMTAGPGLLSGVALALSERLHSGRGRLVSISLYGTGIFCNAPSLLGRRSGEGEKEEEEEEDEGGGGRQKQKDLDTARGGVRILDHARQPLPTKETKAARDEAAHGDPLNRVYRSADGVNYAVCQGAVPDGAREAFFDAFGFTAAAAAAAAGGGNNVDDGGGGGTGSPAGGTGALGGCPTGDEVDFDGDPLGLHMHQLTFAEACETLAALGLPWVRQAPAGTPLDAGEDVAESCYDELSCEDPSLLYTTRIPKVPFDFGCCSPSSVGPGFPAVSLGAHTQAWLKSGWSPRTGPPVPNAAAAKAAKAGKASGIIIFELAETRSSAVAAATLQILDAAGGKANGKANGKAAAAAAAGGVVAVMQLVSGAKNGDADCCGRSYVGEWQGALGGAGGRRFEEHLGRGKTRVACALEDVAAKLANARAVGHQVVLATSLRRSALEAAGLDHATLVRRIPDCVVLEVTPFGVDGREDARGELGAWWLAGTAALATSGYQCLPPVLPPQLGELASSFAVAAALSSALFHLQRTGEGQAVHVALTRTSVFGLVGVSTLVNTFWSDFSKLFFYQGRADGRGWWAKQMPNISSYATKDGAWVMHTPVSGPRLLKSFAQLGIRGRAIVRLVGTIAVRRVAAAVAGLRATGQAAGKSARGESLFFSALKGMNRVQLLIEEKFASMTLAELRAFAARVDLWWCPILAPGAVFRSAQAEACGAIVKPGQGSRGEDVQIKGPLQLR